MPPSAGRGSAPPSSSTSSGSRSGGGRTCSCASPISMPRRAASTPARGIPKSVRCRTCSSVEVPRFSCENPGGRPAPPADDRRDESCAGAPSCAKATPPRPAMCCPSCGELVGQERQYCGRCGARLGQRCPACGARGEPGDQFCGSCGVPLAAGPAPTPVRTAFAGGRYQVSRVLGEGGKKRVYLATDLRLDREVALAVIRTEGLDEAAVARIHGEARAMARLGDHPHAVTVFDVGEDQGQPYIVSQYMAGGSVDDLLVAAERHRLPIEQTLRIGREVAGALAHAHARGVIHRDVKPSNVWLSADGVAKLGDFGLALARNNSRITVDGMMVGTVAYMPPEQALGRPLDARSDLYALGAMLYEMVTGHPPFLGDDAVAVVSQHIHTAPVAPSWHSAAVPRALEALILRMLAKAPGDRPASAAV